MVRWDRISNGTLHGIDQRLWGVGREYLVYVRYELRPLPKQVTDPGPMQAPAVCEAKSELESEATVYVNCLIQQAVRHFQQTMTRAKDGLTKSRSEILKDFDTKLAKVRCTRVYTLEKALKVKLMAVDALGGMM